MGRRGDLFIRYCNSSVQEEGLIQIRDSGETEKRTVDIGAASMGRGHGSHTKGEEEEGA